MAATVTSYCSISGLKYGSEQSGHISILIEGPESYSILDMSASISSTGGTLVQGSSSTIYKKVYFTLTPTALSGKISWSIDLTYQSSSSSSRVTATTSGSKEWSASKKVIDKVYFSDSSFTYDGEEKTLDYTGGGTGVTISGNTGTNAGSYTAKASLNDTTNTEWDGGGTSDITKSWTIKKAAGSCEISPSSQTIICGKSFTVSATGIGEISYSCGTGLSISGTTVKAGNTGDINSSVTATAAGDGNHESATSTCSVYIDKELNEITVPIGTSKVYTGNSLSHDISHSGCSIVEGSEISGTNCGTYTVTFTLPADTSSKKYKWVGGGTSDREIDWYITQATPQIVVDQSAISVNCYASAVSRAATVSNLYITPSYKSDNTDVAKYSGGSISFDKAGSTTVYAYVPADTSTYANWSYAQKPISVTVNKIAGYISWSPNLSLSTEYSSTLRNIGPFDAVLEASGDVSYAKESGSGYLGVEADRMISVSGAASITTGSGGSPYKIKIRATSAATAYRESDYIDKEFKVDVTKIQAGITTAPSELATGKSYDGTTIACVGKQGSAKSGCLIEFIIDYTDTSGVTTSAWNRTAGSVPSIGPNAGTYAVYYRAIAANGYENTVLPEVDRAHNLGSIIISKIDPYLSSSPTVFTGDYDKQSHYYFTDAGTAGFGSIVQYSKNNSDWVSNYTDLGSFSSGKTTVYYRASRASTESSNNVSDVSAASSADAYTVAIDPDWEIDTDYNTITLVSGEGGLAGNLGVKLNSVSSNLLSFSWSFELDWLSWLSAPSSTKDAIVDVTYKKPSSETSYKSGECSYTVSSLAVDYKYNSSSKSSTVTINKKTPTIEANPSVFLIFESQVTQSTLSGSNSSDYNVASSTGFLALLAGNKVNLTAIDVTDSALVSIYAKSNSEYNQSSNVNIVGAIAALPSIEWSASDIKVDEKLTITCTFTFSEDVTINSAGASIGVSRSAAGGTLKLASISGKSVLVTYEDAYWTSPGDVVLDCTASISITWKSKNFTYSISGLNNKKTITIAKAELPWTITYKDGSEWLKCFAGGVTSSLIKIATIKDNAKVSITCAPGIEYQNYNVDSSGYKEYDFKSVKVDGAYIISNELTVTVKTEETDNYQAKELTAKVAVSKNPMPDWLFYRWYGGEWVPTSSIIQSIAQSTYASIKCSSSLSDNANISVSKPISTELTSATIGDWSLADKTFYIRADNSLANAGASIIESTITDSANYYADQHIKIYTISKPTKHNWESYISKQDDENILVNAIQDCKTSFTIYGRSISNIVINSASLTPLEGTISDITSSVDLTNKKVSILLSYLYTNTDTGGIIGTPIATTSALAKTSIDVTYDANDSSGVTYHYPVTISDAAGKADLTINVYKHVPNEWGLTSEKENIYGKEVTKLTVSGTPTWPSPLSNPNVIHFKSLLDLIWYDTYVLSSVSTYNFNQYDSGSTLAPYMPVRDDHGEYTPHEYSFKTETSGSVDYYPYSNDLGVLTIGHPRHFRNISSSPAEGHYNIYKGTTSKSFTLSGSYVGENPTIQINQSKEGMVSATWTSSSTTTGTFTWTFQNELVNDTASISITFPKTDTYEALTLSYQLTIVKEYPAWILLTASPEIDAGSTYTFYINNIPSDDGYTADHFSITSPNGEISSKSEISNRSIEVVYSNTHGINALKDSDDITISITSAMTNKYYAKTLEFKLKINKKVDSELDFVSASSLANLSRQNSIPLSGETLLATLSHVPAAIGEGSIEVIKIEGLNTGTFTASRSDTTISFSGIDLSNAEAGTNMHVYYEIADNFYKRSAINSPNILLRGYQGGTLPLLGIAEGSKYSYDMSKQIGSPSPKGTVTNVTITPDDGGLLATYAESTITFNAASIEGDSSRNYSVVVEMSGDSNYQAGTEANGGEWRFATLVKVYRNLKVWDQNSNNWKIIIPYYFDSTTTEKRCQSYIWDGTKWTPISS